MLQFNTAKGWAGLLLLCAGWLPRSFAQTDGGALPLSRAIALTLEHYPAVKAKRSLLQAAGAHLTDVSHAWWPSLKLHEQVSAGTDNSIYGSYFSMGMIPSTSGGIREGNRTELMSGNIAMAAMQWEIYNFGAYRSKREEARQQQRVSQSDVEVTTTDLTAAVIQDYLNLLQYHALMQIQRDNIERTRSVQRAVTAIVLHGLKPGVDSAIAAAELSKARLNLLDMQNSYNQVRAHLAVLTGLDTAAIRPDTLYNASLMRLLALASDTATVGSRHPLLQYYDALYARQQQHAQVIRREALPKVHLMAAGWLRGSSGQYNDVFNRNLWSGMGYSRYNYLAGLGITYNIADIGHTRDRLAEQQFRTQAAYEQLETSRAALDNLLQQAQVNIRTSLDKLQEMPAQLNAARAAALQKMALYKGGLTNIIEVTNALYLLNRAETDLVQTRAAAWHALFKQAFAGNRMQQLLASLE